jgi:predicted transcriptional regulator
MATVAEIMTEGVLTIAPDAPVEDLARGLQERGIDGAPVMDRDGRVLGMISKTDLTDPQRRVSGKTVEDVMSPVLIAVNGRDPALDAVQRMIDTGTHRVLVIDDHEHPVGIITAMDVLRAVVDGRFRD